MNIAIILAAGKSERAGQNKLWAKIHGQPLWTLAYQRFHEHQEIDHIVLVIPAGEETHFQSWLKDRTSMVVGGSIRMQSFKAGLDNLQIKDDDIILDHNAANPLITSQEISELIQSAKIHGAAAVSQPAVDTLFFSEDGQYTQPLDRKIIRLMQTPQAVRGDILKRITFNGEATDLTSALLSYTPVHVVDAHPLNRKVTYAEDLELLNSRTYFGEDSHRFSQKGTLTLGGLSISEWPALEANSDGDVILHAIGRALAQAQNKSFSEIADPLCAEGKKDSAAYVQALMKDIHIDAITLHIEAARPRIDDLPLKTSLSHLFKISEDLIHISAMSGEGLSLFGRGEGIRCQAFITIQG